MSERSFTEFRLLARVRRGLRGLEGAIDSGAAAVGLTRQQQAFLLSIEASGSKDVPFATVRADLDMDRATASILLARLVETGLVSRSSDSDRRALRVALTVRGRAVFVRSVQSIRRAIREAESRDQLGSLRTDLDAYFDYYLQNARRRQVTRRRPRTKRDAP